MRFFKVFLSLVPVVVCCGLALGQTENRAAQLRDAAMGGRIEEVRAALDAGVSPNAAGERGMTALHLAALNGRTDVVELLLQRGAKVSAIARCDAPGCRGHTPLMTAVLSRRPEIVRRLLKAGAKASDLNSEALALANERGNTELAELLEHAGAQMRPLPFSAPPPPQTKRDPIAADLVKPRGLGGAGREKAASGEVRLAVIADEAAGAEAELLAVELSQRVPLVERQEIDRVLAERHLPTTDRALAGLGQLLGAQGLVLVRGQRVGTNTLLEARFIAVNAGVVLESSYFPLSVPDPAGWARTLARRLGDLAPKCAAEKGRAVALALLNFRASAGTAQGREMESALNVLVPKQLTHEANFFVLERTEMERLAQEKLLAPGTGERFWSSGWLIDGALDFGLTGGEAVTLRLRLQPAAGGKTLESELRGARGKMPELAEAVVAEIRRQLAVKGEAAAWEPQAEADKFFEEAQWAAATGLRAEALAAADAAWALGLRTSELTLLRVAVCTEELDHRAQELRRRQVAWEPPPGMCNPVFNDPLRHQPADGLSFTAGQFLEWATRAIDAYAEARALLRAQSDDAAQWADLDRVLKSAALPLALIKPVSEQRIHAAALATIREGIFRISRELVADLEKTNAEAAADCLAIQAAALNNWAGNDEEAATAMREVLRFGKERPELRAKLRVALLRAAPLAWNGDAFTDRPHLEAWLAVATELTSQTAPDDRALGWVLRFQFEGSVAQRRDAAERFIAAMRELLPLAAENRAAGVALAGLADHDDSTHPFFALHKTTENGRTVLKPSPERRAIIDELRGWKAAPPPAPTTPATEFTRFWHPFGLKLPGVEHRSFGIIGASLQFFAGRIWCYGAFHSENRASPPVAFVFSIDPQNFATEAIALPTFAETDHRKALLVSERWIFVCHASDALACYDRQRKTWSTFPDIKPTPNRVPLLHGDRFFTRVEAGGASGLAMFDPATAESTLLVSSRRNPALTPLDAPGLEVREFGVNASGEISVTCRNAARETVTRIYNPATKTWREPGGGEESFAGPTLPRVTGFSGSGFGLAPGDLALIRQAESQTAEALLREKPYSAVTLPCGRAVLPGRFHQAGFWLVP
jgi:hypothetical protein